MNWILETDRLKLREFILADAESHYEMNLDPDVARYTGDPPFSSVAEARLFLEKYSAYRTTGMGRWAVIRKSDEEFLGWCGLKKDPDTGEFDLGYRFFQKYWGNGYATESALACLSYGFNELKLPEIIGRAMNKNMASIKVLEKVGMRFSCHLDCADFPGVKYVITNPN